MFWIKTIRNLKNEQNAYWSSLNQICKNIENIQERINPIADKLIELEKEVKADGHWIEGLRECITNDRKDINALIQLVKKSTKGKK